jgi:hypothetical protein
VGRDDHHNQKIIKFSIGGVLCQEKIELGRLEVEGAEAGREEHARGQDPAGIVFVLVVGLRFPIKLESPAIT